jgi:hypothetical protein
VDVTKSEKRGLNGELVKRTGSLSANALSDAITRLLLPYLLACAGHKHVLQNWALWMLNEGLQLACRLETTEKVSDLLPQTLVAESCRPRDCYDLSDQLRNRSF